MTIFKAMTIEMNEMSETQKTATSAALDTCIASDLKLPTPPPNVDAEPMKQGDKALEHAPFALLFLLYINFNIYFNINIAIKKYGEQTNPMRVLFCLVKSLIINVNHYEQLKLKYY